MELSKERIEQYANDPRMCNVNDEIREMARRLLAAEEQQPFGYYSAEVPTILEQQGHANIGRECAGEYRMPLYLRPQQGKAVQVPEDIASAFIAAIEKEQERLFDEDYLMDSKDCIDVIREEIQRMKACRAAMLTSEPVSNRDELRENIRREHADWSQSTFGNVGPVGPLKHLSKEAIEAAEAPEDLSEWADMQFLLWDAQRRAGITDKQITLAMIEKLAINKARIWPEPKDGEPRLHITSVPQPEVPGE